MCCNRKILIISFLKTWLWGRQKGRGRKMVQIEERSCFQAVLNNLLSLSLEFIYIMLYLACLSILDMLIKRKHLFLLVKKLLVAFCTKISYLIETCGWLSSLQVIIAWRQTLYWLTLLWEKTKGFFTSRMSVFLKWGLWFWRKHHNLLGALKCDVFMHWCLYSRY